MLRWGTEVNPAGPIRELSGTTSGWKDIICSKIKTR
jgi:hypothetical protein